MSWLRSALITLILRPIALLITGVDIVGRERLPLAGPAIVACNHNSHMDTLLLLALFPSRALSRLRPAAAADYFLANPALAWFARRIVGIVPVERAMAGQGVDVLAPAKAALAAGDILLIFPEGTRGADGHAVMAPLKSGVARLAEAFPDAAVTPVWIQGAGRVLPKGKAVPVPLTCCVLVGEPIRWAGDREALMAELRAALEALQAQAPPLRWKETE
jgi:1-acyl-sn-glycerol-3-phosphate acyltransferase